ncbi:hypothetical protein CORC01_10399 [Colletotrichum orchidophilum]|uniref:Uncharacterized protein n=1 Tax=Colletotrichum orchidophilum TaxID=1209926 RepID=A0A1G4AZ90_9PEZI|nr:uncharacterized protein CORC01_10399 [Colletotrichum orchidophilum]OHE94352.1 hypothetical protein CORC01_10399 [Colletotrichum orchidophilum]
MIRNEKITRWASVAAGSGCLLPCPAVVRFPFHACAVMGACLSSLHSPAARQMSIS